MSSHQYKPTELELQDIKVALTKLWELDTNRLQPGRDYKVNLPIAGYNHHHHHSDHDSQKQLKFFEGVKADILQKPTFKSFIALLDNYIAQTGIAEVVDHNEISENLNFLKLTWATAPMQYVYHYLIAKGKVKNNEREFQANLNKMWFNMYRREGRKGDSSAFEHVFLGEVRDGKAMGFHNWINFYLNERQGYIHYQGYVKPREAINDSGPDPTEHVLPIRFTYKGAPKSFSISFVGTSPEFELALYTLLFYLERQDTAFIVQDIRLNMKVHSFYQDGLRRLGSAYPEIRGHIAE
ncbi:hypothetical protein G9A89_011082 [Geosiphon pyriformis]|nr:hypothetical protein G9A89_011082 [Geosiphon pyriformis]